MSIFLANNPRHKKIQRQYWAIFKFGKTVEGCMRFSMPKERSGSWDIEEYEEACMLDDDDWVGPAPNGTQKLQFRWKAKNQRGYKPSWATEEYSERINFEIGDDGRLASQSETERSVLHMLFSLTVHFYKL
jgi:hypothetical protein